jgi:catechol 2,3-dioxygenase-like lactoylglutathione lyase family enzyme
MDQRLSLVTLGVADLAASVGFYGRLGWTPANAWQEQGVAFFQGVGGVVALWDRGALAADSAVEDGGGWGGVTLAHNVATEDEVRAVLEEARAAGARIGREAAPTPWGGFSGIFVDPDGHPWEVARNPFWTLGPDGAVRLGDPAS